MSYTATPYSNGSVQELMRLKNLPPSADSPALFMAPPLLHDSESGLYISQTQAIVSHLARKLGMAPDDPDKLTVAEMVVANCNDVLADLSRNNGHQMWSPGEWAEFIHEENGRFIKWLRLFECIGVKYGLSSDAGFVLGTPAATFADTSVFALWAMMERSLPGLSPILRRHAPKIMALCDRLGTNVGLAAFFSSQPASPYCGGQIERSIRSVVGGTN